MVTKQDDAIKIKSILADIGELRGIWAQRNSRFKEWYETLMLVDKLQTKNKESGVTNEPRTFYELSNYLLTAGDIRHIIPIATETADELDKQARVERGCQYLWDDVDRRRMLNGKQPFLSELMFNVLTLGWYALIASFDIVKLQPIVELWSPVLVYPRYDGGEMVSCVHEYEISTITAVAKARKNNWDYNPVNPASLAKVKVANYFFWEDGVLKNIIFIEEKPVTPIETRTDVLLLVSPVGGFPDMGEILKSPEWGKFLGQSILEPNMGVYEASNKWLTFQMQILRDTAEHKWQETSSGPPKVSAENLTKRNALFQFNPGEGLSPIVPPPIPLELRAMLIDFRANLQKGSFSDMLYGIFEGTQTGILYSQVADAANRVLHHQQQHKHMIISEVDRFWLKILKNSKKVLPIRGRVEEKLKPTDIPSDAFITVTSELATPRDWLERATIANQLRGILDETTTLDTILKLPDTEAVKRRKLEDLVTNHPLGQSLHLIRAIKKYAEFLDRRGDKEGAELFRKAAAGLEAQFGAPPPGAAPAPGGPETPPEQEAGPGGIAPTLGGGPGGGVGAEGMRNLMEGRRRENGGV